MKGVFEQWNKLLELTKSKAVQVAKEDAIAEMERLEREWIEKKKKEAEENA